MHKGTWFEQRANLTHAISRTSIPGRWTIECDVVALYQSDDINISTNPAGVPTCMRCVALRFLWRR